MPEPTAGQPAAPAVPAAPATPATPATPAAPAATAASEPPKTDPPAVDDKPLGPNGEKALQAERDARKELEKQIAALSPLQAIADALGAKNPADAKSELEQLNERLSNHEGELAREREARWRAEVAHEKGMTPEQALELRGTTREELVAHADRLAALFPTTAPGTPGTPRPDPTQGSRGAVDIDAQIKDAEAKGNVQESIRLKQIKFASK